MDGKNNWIFYFVGASGAGILLRSFFDGGVALIAAVLSAAGVCVVLLRLYKKSSLFLLAIVCFGIALGLLRMEWSAIQGPDPVLSGYLEKSIELVGVVSAEPDKRDRNQLITITAKTVNGEETFGKVLASADSYVPIVYGDELRATGVLTLPEDFETDSGRVFNYTRYLAKEGIHFRMFYPTVEILTQGKGNPILHALFLFKQRFLERLAHVIQEPEVSLLGGLLVGAKQSLGEGLLETFRITGLIHIVVLSGYNMSIIALGLKRIFFFLPPIWGAVSGGVIIVLFTLMAGASAATVRASIMALFVLLAQSTGRAYEITRALFIAAFFMFMYNPHVVAFDPGFQLSFLATVGLIRVAPRFERYLTFVPGRFGMRALVSATVSTQLAVLPLLLYQTGTISVVAVLSNLLVLPVIPFTMLFGSLTGLASLVGDAVAYPFALLTTALLSYMLWIAEHFASVPYATVSLREFPLLAMALVYALTVPLFFFSLRQGKGQTSFSSRTAHIPFT